LFIMAKAFVATSQEWLWALSEESYHSFVPKKERRWRFMLREFEESMATAELPVKCRSKKRKYRKWRTSRLFGTY
jgi:hypothetical protein